MSETNSDLVHRAESLLEGLHSRQKQLSRLFEIENELKSRGVENGALFTRIDALRDEADPSQFRCRYQFF